MNRWSLRNCPFSRRVHEQERSSENTLKIVPFSSCAHLHIKRSSESKGCFFSKETSTYPFLVMKSCPFFYVSPRTQDTSILCISPQQTCLHLSLFFSPLPSRSCLCAPLNSASCFQALSSIEGMQKFRDKVLMGRDKTWSRAWQSTDLTTTKTTIGKTVIATLQYFVAWEDICQRRYNVLLKR